MSPNVTINVGVEAVNHVPRITELNAGAAVAFDHRSDESVKTHLFKKTIFVATEPADTVGSAKGVLKGEGSGNKPSLYTCEADVATYAA